MRNFIVTLCALVTLPSYVYAGTTRYSAVVADTSCVGVKSCVLSFPIVGAGKTLTIDHVSCGILTTGQSGEVYDVVLSTTMATNPALGDHLSFEGFSASGNIENVVSQATIFYVSAGDNPTVAITSAENVAKSSDGSCFISGTTSP